MKTNKLNGFVSIILTLTLVLGAVGGLSASAETTIVTSPFTEPVKQVRDSVVGVNSYVNYTPRSNNYSYGNGYGGFGFGGGLDDFFGDFFGDSDPFGFGGGRGNYQEPAPETEDSTRQILQGGGSGVVVAEGYVLTNYHVVSVGTSWEVTTEEKTYPATVVASNEAQDLAVLYVEDLDLKPVTLGDSDALVVGDWAICIGNPLIFSGTITVGIISALGREISSKSTDVYGKRVTNDMIQTDAAINSGNSGGGLFNVAGELVGVPSMKYTASAYGQASVEGIGMAIPINVAKPLIEQAVAGGGKAQAAGGLTGRPRLGVTVSNLPASIYTAADGLLPKGAYVSAVEEGSPAQKGGMMAGDIVVEIDGNIIQTTTQMTDYLQTKQAGDTVSVKVYRVRGGLDKAQGSNLPSGEYIDLQVTLAVLEEVAQ